MLKDVTNTLSWLDLRHTFPYLPWVSARFTNNGPSAVLVGLNFPDDRFCTLEPGETRAVNPTEQIIVIFFKTFPGLQATIEVEGKF